MIPVVCFSEKAWMATLRDTENAYVWFKEDMQDSSGATQTKYCQYNNLVPLPDERDPDQIFQMILRKEIIKRMKYFFS